MGEKRDSIKKFLLFLLSHHSEEYYSRTLKINSSIRLCSRCTGMFIGFITIILLEIFLFPVIPWFFAYPLMVSLVIPAIIDWTTQKYRLRESNNKLRVLTGFLLGAAFPLIIYQKEILLLVDITIFSTLMIIMIIIFKT